MRVNASVSTRLRENPSPLARRAGRAGAYLAGPAREPLVPTPAAALGTLGRSHVQPVSGT